MGGILLAADKGLTGLWFEGKNTSPSTLTKRTKKRNCPYSRKPSGGLTSIFRVESLTFPCRFTSLDQTFKMMCGTSFVPFPMERPRPTAKSHNGSPLKRACHECPHRQSEVQSPATKFQSSYPATASWAQTATSLDTPAASKKVKLLELEKADMKSLFIPKNGTAL